MLQIYPLPQVPPPARTMNASGVHASSAGVATAAAPGQSLLTTLEREFRTIEAMDPSVSDGFHITYDREVPFELRAADCKDTADIGALEGIKVKIVVQGNELGNDASGLGMNAAGGTMTTLRIELSSEADLFFHYTCVINHIGFLQLREDQKLMCEFRDFSVTTMKMFNRCIKEPKQYLAILLLQPNGEACLQLVQNLEYKFIELLSLPFRESSEQVIRQHVTYRYNALRSRLGIMTAKLQDVSALVKVKGGPAGHHVPQEALQRGITGFVEAHQHQQQLQRDQQQQREQQQREQQQREQQQYQQQMQQQRDAQQQQAWAHQQQQSQPMYPQQQQPQQYYPQQPQQYQPRV